MILALNPVECDIITCVSADWSLLRLLTRRLYVLIMNRLYCSGCKCLRSTYDNSMGATGYRTATSNACLARQASIYALRIQNRNESMGQ